MEYHGEIKCPKCNKSIYGHTAISRVDNKTEICSDCGYSEAMDAYHNFLKNQKK